MRAYKSYASDPHWITARFDSKDANGKAVKKGDRVFYYPRSKIILSGKEAEQASSEFASAAADEAFETGCY